MTGFNIKEENHIHESILFRHSANSKDVILINYCILYAKHYMYLVKLNEEQKTNVFNVDLLGYLCHIMYTLKIETTYLY